MAEIFRRYGIIVDVDSANSVQIVLVMIVVVAAAVVVLVKQQQQ